MRNKIENNPELREIELFRVVPRFHSTTQASQLIAWWGEGSYWDNRSKKEPELLDKKFGHHLDESFETNKPHRIQLDPESLEGKIIDYIFHDDEDVILTTKHGEIITISCASGTTPVINGPYELIKNNEIETVVGDLYEIRILFDKGKVITIEDDTGGEGLEIWGY